MRKYRGDLLEKGVNFAFALVFIGILLGAGAIALTAMVPSPATNGTEAWNNSIGIASYATNSTLNLAQQTPTIGTIAGVGLIILVLFTAIGAYVFGLRSQ